MTGIRIDPNPNSFLILLTMSVSMSFAQSSGDSITMKKVFGGYEFYQSDKRLSMKQLVNASIVGFVGGFKVGWPLGSAMAGGEPNWTIAGIDAGLIVVSIPISKSANNKAKLAVDAYNGGIQTSSFWDNRELKLSMTGNGIGLTLNF